MEYLQIAGSLVVTLIVVLVVPDGKVANAGRPLDMMGGVMSPLVGVSGVSVGRVVTVVQSAPVMVLYLLFPLQPEVLASKEALVNGPTVPVGLM